MEDNTIMDLVEQVDIQMLKWMSQNKISPLNLSAIILARLTWLAQQTNCTEDFLHLLESPREAISKDDKEQVVH
jgi:hypothetical protein